MEIALLFILFFGMCLIRVPVAIALSISSMIIGIGFLGLTPVMMVQQLYRGLDSFPLLAIPLFLLVGQLMNSGEITDRLMTLSRSLVGHIKGGLGHINVLVSMFFAGISGAASADTAGIGSVLIPAMIKEGYDKPITVAITVASSTLSSIIPPSIMMLIYGAIGGVSIGGLYLGGAIPGILLGLSQMVLVYIYAKKRNYPSYRRATLRELAISFKGGFLPLLIPVIIIGGVILGFFTATESAMIAALYSLVLILFVYRTMSVKDLPKVFQESVFMYAQPLFAIGAATVFGWILAYLEGPKMVLEWFGPYLTSPETTLLFVVLLFTLVGTFMDATPAIIIFLPVVQELAMNAGIHPVHMGIVVTLTLCMGLITPPYGLCLMLGCQIANTTTKEVIGTVAIFYIVFAVILLAVIFIPGVTLFLPKLLMPNFL